MIAREKVKWCENCAMLEKMYLDARAMHDTQVGDIRALHEENARLKAKLARCVELAHDGQSRDALHAFDALLKIERLAAAKGEK